ncbi:hypothetical protein pVco14_071 [Vibrio phage pVco-14]|nr:hypothetical protein pVco14_071 [Vibrio phage pVco-14]
MAYDNGDFDFTWGEMNPREPLSREEFDKLYDECMERGDAHQRALMEAYAHPPLDQETHYALMEQAEQMHAEDRALAIRPRCHGNQDPVIMLEAIAEAAKLLGKAAEKAQVVFVVTAECLAQNPQLEEIAAQFGGKIITSETMPKAIDATDILSDTLKQAQPKVEQFGRSMRAHSDGPSRKGERGRKRQQWRRK